MLRCVSPALKITPLAARRFLRRTHGLDVPFSDVATALTHHGYIQIDPLNICGRMHDLILRNRVTNYREGDLMRHLHGDEKALSPRARVGFEHHLPHNNVLAAFPLEAWPHLLAAMRTRTKRAGPWSGRLSPRERELASHILAEISVHGPLSSDQIDDPRRARRVWGSATLAKSTLQKLFFHGRVLIARRVGIRRLYDLPERVLPQNVLAQREPSPAETNRWVALLKLRQRRLALLKREELRVLEDLVQPVVVTGIDSPTLHCLREDAPLFSEISNRDSKIENPAVRFLAPLDPLIYDRRVTAALWNFDYTWEAYTPPHKRVRGHYALPVLSGTELVGHVEPKADRVARTLAILSRSVRRGHVVAPALRTFAQWLGLRTP
jgi:uncharacterized protein YcaQ